MVESDYRKLLREIKTRASAQVEVEDLYDEDFPGEDPTALNFIPPCGGRYADSLAYDLGETPEDCRWYRSLEDYYYTGFNMGVFGAMDVLFHMTVEEFKKYQEIYKKGKANES